MSGSALQESTETCELCDFGTFQSSEGATTCESCPPGTTTLAQGSKSSANCIRKTTRSFDDVNNIVDLCRKK